MDKISPEKPATLQKSTGKGIFTQNPALEPSPSTPTVVGDKTREMDTSLATDGFLFGDMGQHDNFFSNPFKTPSKHRLESTNAIHLTLNNNASPMRSMTKKVTQSTKKLLTRVSNAAHRLLTPFKKVRRHDGVEYAAVSYTPNDMEQMGTDIMDNATVSYGPDVMDYDQQVVDTQCYAEVLGGETSQARDSPVLSNTAIRNEMSSPMQIFSRIVPSEEISEIRVEGSPTPMLIYHPNDADCNQQGAETQHNAEIFDDKTTHAKGFFGLSNAETSKEMSSPMSTISRTVLSEKISEMCAEGISSSMPISRTADDMSPTKSPMPTISRIVPCEKISEKCVEEPSTPLLISRSVPTLRANTHVMADNLTPLKSDTRSGELQWSSTTLVIHSPVIAPKDVPGPSSVGGNDRIPPGLHLASPPPLQKTPVKEDTSSPMILDSIPKKENERVLEVVPVKKGRNLLNMLEIQKSDFIENKTPSPSPFKKTAEEATDLVFRSTPSESSILGEESGSAPTMSSKGNNKCSGGTLSGKKGDQLLSFLKNLGSNVKNGFSSIKKGREFEESASTSESMPPVNTFKETTSIEALGTGRVDQRSRNTKLAKHPQLLKVKKVEPRKPRTPKPKPVEVRDPLSYLLRSPFVSEHESLKAIRPLLPKPEDFEEYDLYEEMPPRLPLPISPLAVKSYPESILPPWVDPCPEKTARRNLQKMLLAETPAGSSSVPTTSTVPAAPNSQNDNDKEPKLLTEGSTGVDANN